MTKQYTDLIKDVVTDMASFPSAVLVKAALRKAAREFADHTHTLVVPFDLDTVVDQREYNLLPEFEGSIKQVYKAFQRSEKQVSDAVDGSELSNGRWDILEGDTADAVDVLVTAESFGLTLEPFTDSGETLNSLPVLSNAGNTHVLFCGFNTESGVGAVYYLSTLEEYVNAQAGELPTLGYYLPAPFDDVYGDYVALAGEAGSGVATVARSVTEGVQWKFSFNPGCAPRKAQAAGLRVKCVMLPDHYADGLPAWWMNRYADALVCGARSKLLSIPNRKWTDRELAGVESRRFDGKMADAKWDRVTNRQSGVLRPENNFL